MTHFLKFFTVLWCFSLMVHFPVLKLHWSSSPLATWCEELTHRRRPWCWERLKVGGEGDDRGWEGWMASPTRRTWVWASSRSWWWTGMPGVRQSVGPQRVRRNWATEQHPSQPDFRLTLGSGMLKTVGLERTVVPCPSLPPTLFAGQWEFVLRARQGGTGNKRFLFSCNPHSKQI